MLDQPEFFNRDLSWLSFNGTVLAEAAKPDVPLLERIQFLAIYSSNLDEFYRVRVPLALALSTIDSNKKEVNAQLVNQIQQAVNEQQIHFGTILTNEIIPELRANSINLVYNQPIPSEALKPAEAFFYNTLAAYIQVIFVKDGEPVFLQNNQLYLAVALKGNNAGNLALVTIPNEVNRFFSVSQDAAQYLFFIDDIIRNSLPALFRDHALQPPAYAIKVTRDAELNIGDELYVDLAAQIEEQIGKRDLGLASRLLYDGSMPPELLQSVTEISGMSDAIKTPGGRYHNLRDFFSFPVHRPEFRYPKQVPIAVSVKGQSIFDFVARTDQMVHTPYMSYDPVLRFFNEAAIDPEVSEIYTTIYRVARNSQIGGALITAAKNGKKVTVFVELKARFDEENNIQWSKRMKAAGVTIINSIPRLKVHAKVTLVKRRRGLRDDYFGLFSTGNFNEKTAAVYTDQILLTANKSLLRELELLFIFLKKRRKPLPEETGLFKELLVAGFNLKERMEQLIDREIANAAKGLSAGIRIKLNNLEEETLILKLYEASNAGVTIELIVRGICRLVPGVEKMSENIKVKRIVDRYLEHGRVFIFHNNGSPEIYLGSADWMNRNIYRRIEVCYPLVDERLKQEVNTIVDLQWKDDQAAVIIDSHLNLKPEIKSDAGVKSQAAIETYLKKIYQE